MTAIERHHIRYFFMEVTAMTSQVHTKFASCFPGRRVFYKSPGQPSHEVSQYYLKYDRRPPEFASCRIEPNVVVLNETDNSVFVETNSCNMVGPRINRRNRLVALWGDSIVMGYGRGWIQSLSERFPGYQFLNGGVPGHTFMETANRAAYFNQRLTISYNILFPGWNQRFHPSYATDFHAAFHRLVNMLPNVILCTQPTSLNATMIHIDPKQYAATKEELRYRSGYKLWDGEVSADLARYFWHYLNIANQIVWQVAAECREHRGKYVPVMDFYSHFQTDSKPDFRADFIDSGHLRVEAYPNAWGFLCNQLETILPPLSLAGSQESHKDRTPIVELVIV